MQLATFFRLLPALASAASPPSLQQHLPTPPPRQSSSAFFPWLFPTARSPLSHFLSSQLTSCPPNCPTTKRCLKLEVRLSLSLEVRWPLLLLLFNRRLLCCCCGTPLSRRETDKERAGITASEVKAGPVLLARALLRGGAGCCFCCGCCASQTRLASFRASSSSAARWAGLRRSTTDGSVHGSRSEQPTQESPLRPVLHVVQDYVIRAAAPEAVGHACPHDCAPAHAHAALRHHVLLVCTLKQR